MMVETRRAAPLVEAGDLSAPPGSRLWSLAIRLELQALLHDKESNAERLQRNLQGMREHEGYRQLLDAQGRAYATYEAFCVDPPPYGLGYDPDALDHIVSERNSPQARARAPKTLLDPGPPTIEERHNRPTGTVTKRSSNTDYLIARLARDRKDLLERVRRGELSVTAAARIAGIRPPEATVRLDDMGSAARTLRSRLTREQRADLASRLTREVD